MKRARILLYASLLVSTQAMAASIEQPLANAAQEQRARALFVQMKCVVCEGQSLADSDSMLAKQMRARIREQLAEGKTDSQVVTFFRDAYGDRILMQPPVKPATLPLWLAPLLLLAVGAWVLKRTTKRGNE